METEAGKVAKCAHKVVRVGDTTPIVGSNDLDEANANAAERNKRAADWGVKSRYEVVSS